MTPEQFEAIFESVKSEDTSVTNIKRFVLNCALGGKLVPQFECEQGVEKLISDIKKQNKSVVKLENNDQAHLSIPKTWCWVPALFPAATISTKGKQIPTKQISETGLFPVIDQGKEFIRGYSDDQKKIIKVSEKILLFGDHTREVKLIDFDFIVGADGTKIFEPIKIDPDFYFYALTWLPLEARGYSRHFKLLKKSFIPLPPLEEQKRIVAKVDELMALCNEIENTNQKTNHTKLTYLKSLTKNISDGAINKDKQAILTSAFAKAPKNTEGIQELKKVCINFGIQMDQQSGKENEKVFEKLRELTDRMKVDKLLPKSFLIHQLESEIFSTLSNLSLGSIAFIEKGKTGIKSAEPGEYPLVVTAAERKTCKSYDFETDAAIVPLVSSTGHGHASIHRLHFQSGRFALGTILAAVIPFEEELFSSRFIYEYLTTFKEKLLVSRMTGTANVTLSVSKIGEVPIPIISSKTQKWICDFCKICDQLAISYKKESSIQDDLLKKLIA